MHRSLASLPKARLSQSALVCSLRDSRRLIDEIEGEERCLEYVHSVDPGVGEGIGDHRALGRREASLTYVVEVVEPDRDNLPRPNRSGHDAVARHPGTIARHPASAGALHDGEVNA